MISFVPRRVAAVVTFCCSAAFIAAPVFAATPAPSASGRVQASGSVASETLTLPNGATLILRSDRTSPRIAVSILVRAGAADESPTTAGWRRLLSEAMLSSVPDPNDANRVLTPTQLGRVAERAGGRIGISVGDDVVEIWGAGDSAQTGPLLDLMLSLALHPRLSDSDIEAARARSIERLDDEQGQVANRAAQALEGQLFRDANGALTTYGLPANGTAQTLAALTPQQLRLLHAQYFRTARYTIGAAGDLDVATLRRKLGAGEAASPQSAGNRPFFAPAKRGTPPLVVRQMRTDASWVVVGYAVAGSGSGDAPALRVLTAALSETPRARLNARLLSGQTLFGGLPVQEVQAQFSARRYGSELILFAQTGAQNVDEVKNAMLDEARKLRDGLLSARELESARNFARGSWAVERESLRERAFQAALASASNAPADILWPARVATVSAQDVQRVARKYLSDYAVALILPQSETPDAP